MKPGQSPQASGAAAAPADARKWFVVAIALTLAGVLFWRNATAVDPILEKQAGARHLLEGRPAEAVPHFERALGVADDAETRFQLANALKAAGRAADASREYKRALTLDPHNAAIWFNFGNLLRGEFHDTRNALEAYRRATENDPTFADAQFSLGAMLLESGDFDAAVATLQSALQIAPPGAAWRADAETTLDVARLRAAEAKGLLPPPRK